MDMRIVVFWLACLAVLFTLAACGTFPTAIN